MTQPAAAAPPTSPSPNTPSPAADGRILIFLIAAAMFMENLDGTIIATALPAIARSFGHAAIDLNIGISAYLLALGIFIPASGWVADRFGTRRIFALAIVLFTLASVLSGLSQNLAQFVSARILQGAAGAMMVPVGRLVVLRQTPPERLMEAMATLVWPSLVAPVLGPPLGGFITTHADWRWIFYLNLPLGAIALVAALRIVPDLRAAERPAFDWPGFALCGIGVVALLTGLERLGQQVDATGVVLFFAGVLLLVVCMRHFARTAAPMIDLSAWRILTFRVAIRGGSLWRMAIGSAPFLLPLMFQVGFGFTAEKSGLLMLGVFGANLGMKAVTSRLLRRFGFRAILLANGLLCSLALAACALLTAHTGLAPLVIVLAIGGASRSMQFTTITMITFADVPQPQMRGANGLAATTAQLAAGAGITLGAISVRAGHVLAGLCHMATPAADYRIAFVIVALVALTGLIDAFALPAKTGGNLVSGHRG